MPRRRSGNFSRHYPELRGKRLALFIGRIHPKKGCDLLIEAYAKVLGQDPDWHLVIAGPDQVGLREDLHYRAAELGIAPTVTWTGMLSGTMKWGALRSAEVFVLPSHQENFGIAVAEALAAGTPTLISNKVNIWREIEADGAGIVAEDTLEGTRQLFQSYVELSEQKRMDMRGQPWTASVRDSKSRRQHGTLHAVLSDVTGTKAIVATAGGAHI